MSNNIGKVLRLMKCVAVPLRDIPKEGNIESMHKIAVNNLVEFFVKMSWWVMNDGTFHHPATANRYYGVEFIIDLNDRENFHSLFVLSEIAVIDMGILKVRDLSRIGEIKINLTHEGLEEPEEIFVTPGDGLFRIRSFYEDYIGVGDTEIHPT